MSPTFPRAALGTATLGLSLLAPVVAAPSAGATFPGTTHVLAFAATQLGGLQDIWVKDGSSYTQLTHSPNANDKFPAYSADGKHIVWIRDDDVWVMGAQGHNPHALTTDGHHGNVAPTFTPTGDVVARDSRTGLEIITLDGTITSLGIPGDHPSVAPDGTIAFDRWKPSDSAHQIFEVQQNGSGLTQITTDTGHESMQPDWAPDGQSILFQYRGYNGIYRIATMAPDGSNPTILFSVKRKRAGLSEPTYSPDASLIAYARSDYKTGQRVWTIDASGDLTTAKVVSNLKYAYDPAWRPGP